MLRAAKRTPFGVQILIGLVLGVVLGLIARNAGSGIGGETGWLTVTLETIGDTFVTLLKALVPPLVFLAVVASIANLRQVTNAARLAGQTLLWFAITALVSVGIGIALGLVTNPGLHTSVPAPPRPTPVTAAPGWTSWKASSRATSSACRPSRRSPTGWSTPRCRSTCCSSSS